MSLFVVNCFGINSTISKKHVYDKASNLVKTTDYLGNVTTRFQYDLIGRVTGIEASDGQKLHMVYDNYNRVSMSKWVLGSNAFTTGYIYGNKSISGQKNGLLYGVKVNGTERVGYQYDELTRLQNRTLNTTTPFTTTYGYLEGATYGTTTTLVKTMQNGNNTLEYTYDELGNILSVSKNGTVIEQYTYDTLNQLTEATYGGNAYTYAYDHGGNLTEVKKNGVVINSYTYGDAEWKDLLTAFNGQTITYDTIGNPLTYRNGMSFTWQNGRQLASITQNGSTLATYTYNADGLRTSKTVNGTKTDYYWMNGTLQGQKTGDTYLFFLYDESGRIFGFVEKTSTSESYYYYEFNLQGDIIGIINSAGTRVVEYTYGAWGDLLSVTGSLASTLGQTNPLRYRGYYYDAETGFYYLNSRYYNPEVGRFINADAQLNSDMLGFNIYSYCGNNPIMRADDSGQGWWIVAGALVGGLVSVGVKMLSNYATGKKWNEGIIGAFVGGAVAGAIVAATGGTALAASGGVISAFAGAASEAITNETISYIPVVSKLNGQSSTKKASTKNIADSALTVVRDTAVNGTIATITGGVAGKIVPTNPYWIKPQKFTSSFVGKYALKSELQSITQGLLDFCYNGVNYINGKFNNHRQQLFKSLFPAN